MNTLKAIFSVILVVAFVSCNKTTDEKKEEKTVVKNTSAVVGLQTAFVDTQKLMEENSEAKDITDKYDKIVKSK